MQCDQIRERLSAYLDGELDGDRGSAVRGHLRECASCRRVSEDEAALRDGLRTLAPIDPPPSLWAGVQARLAAAEVADAKLPRWRRVVSRWRANLLGATRPILVGGALAAMAVTVLWWRAQQHDEAAQVAGQPPVDQATPSPTPAPLPIVTPPAIEQDVIADLASESSRIAAEYEAAATEVLALAATARVQWSDTQRTRFDEQVAVLRAAIERAGDDAREARRAWRALIRYVQTAVARDEVAMLTREEGAR